MGKGLSAAIMNPYSLEMMKAYKAFCALNGKDNNCADYINFAATIPTVATEAQISAIDTSSKESYASELQKAIIKGLKERAAELTGELLTISAPLDIVQNEIIPALDVVGKGFEEKRVYLPQLLMSAEAAKAAFERIKEKIPAGASDKCRIVIATVKGDIHDIGKNIVKLLLENYGFAVCDLGKDVPPETIVDTAERLDAKIICLSALMTTTVPAMEDTIKLARKQTPKVKIIVGGAVLTQEYADRIGADKYAKDAMEAVRYAESIN